MDILWHPTTILVALHAIIITSVGMRVVMARAVPSVALAWLFLVALLPGIGLFCYVGVGERRLGGRRARRLAELRRPYVQRLRELLFDRRARVDWAALPDTCEAMDQLGLTLAGMRTLSGNELRLLPSAAQALRAILDDIERASRTLQMQFYIWEAGGSADDVVAAVSRAAKRGVACSLIVDALGSAAWLRGAQPRQLRDAGVEITVAMPTGPWRALFRRNDLRNHRKIIIVDDEIAYTGSMNMVDPRLFRRDRSVGQWIDAMVRMRGPAVEALRGVLLSDRFLETQLTIEELFDASDVHEQPRAGPANVQVLPSGPAGTEDAILQMLLMLLYAARRRVVITTPYFVPDEAMLRAIRSAAARGVQVTLIVPARVDSVLVRHASRSCYADLLAVGVGIQCHEGGMLHTKSIVVDERITMFGTANLDMRSLWLNYEVSLFVYDADFGAQVHALQEGYLRNCTAITSEAWDRRPLRHRVAENLARLFSPLL